jgi:hypothetical protein
MIYPIIIEADLIRSYGLKSCQKSMESYKFVKDLTRKF